MANKAIFLDRDNTLIEDPGYLADPQAVKLLPGVELALKSMAQAGFKLIVVTNQSGIARGMLTQETLGKIHAEMRRQLAEHDAHVDGIYYCPFHPEGTVPEFAKDSDLRKPRPGMLFWAAKEHDIDLTVSWLVGDSARDIEAGQRAGCRTVRVRTRPAHHTAPGEENDEDVQADYTVRNLVDAARVILRSPQKKPSPPLPGAGAPAAPRTKAAGLMEDTHPVAREVGAPAIPEEAETPAPDEGAGGDSDDSAVRMEILKYVRQLARNDQVEEFSFVKLFGAIVQVIALLALLIVFVKMIGSRLTEAMLWALICIALQLMSLTLFFGVRRK